MGLLPEPAPAGDLLNEALEKVAPGSVEARALHRGLRQLEGFAGEDLAAKSVRAVSEAILTARKITGRRDRVKLPSRG
ncbi:hypothetical protein HTS88_12190 [Pseudarthrobacter oxydans]|uniref:hypothetical protein n=1 Tax=Pseudarthrobacter oxydans TaxID=1671 RepID=UPI0015736EFC|nr:hypothetical protein [Pseudarthrobacter oxydans]NSX37158.1 hypothetical protein [Pseudarthrobacter oxydans]